MRGIWINAMHKRVDCFRLDTSVATLEPLQAMVGGGVDQRAYLEHIGVLGKEGSFPIEVYGDEEGRLKQLKYGFSFSQAPNFVIYGNAVVLAADYETGDWVDMPELVKWETLVKERVRWHDLSNVDALSVIRVEFPE